MDGPGKIGWQTSEFWVALGSQIISIAVLLHWVEAGDAATLQGAVQNGAVAAVALASAAAVGWKYIHARTTVKTAAMEKQPTQASAVAISVEKQN